MAFEGDPPAAAQTQVLPDRRELALVAVERTRMPMVVTDPLQHDNPIVLANQAFLDLTGYSADEVTGRNCRFLQGPETSPDDIEKIRRGLAEDAHFIQVEMLNYRKNGLTFWNQLCISPVHDENGKTIYYFASQIDATAQRRAEELEAIERLLLMEVDHRSMNALALVESFLSLTQADNVSGFSDAVRDRVGAIASAHRLLAESSWTGAYFHELVTAVAPPTVEARGAQTKLSPNMVQPLALVLNELVLNASQNGALQEPDGSVHITWEAAPDRLAITWTEAGTKSIDASDQEPDFRLLRAIVERQLAGAAFVEMKQSILSVQLVVPLNAARANLENAPE